MVAAAGLAKAGASWDISDGLGLLLPLVPWAARNWRVLHEVQFLAPRYSELPGEYTPLGLTDWTNTWMWRFRDVYRVTWKVNDEQISVDDLPARCIRFSRRAGTRRGVCFEKYNESLTMDPEVDSQFREIARERTERHPLRTYFKGSVFARAGDFGSRRASSCCRIRGACGRYDEEWEEDRTDLLATLALVVVNAFYLALAIWGAWMARASAGLGAAGRVYCWCARCSFTIFVEAPEPRYVLECFPAVIALAAQVFARRKSAFFDRLGMNREAENLRKAFLHAIFEGGGDVVDFGDRKAAVHRAVAGNENFVVDAADVHLVAIDQLVVFRLKRVQEILHGSREPFHFFGAGDASAERLDMNIDAARGDRWRGECLLRVRWRCDALRGGSSLRSLRDAAR